MALQSFTTFMLASLAFASGIAAGVPSTTQAATPLCTDYRQWVGGTAYKSGDVVSNRGGVYRCKTGSPGLWCQFAAYEPGTSTGSNAWDRQGDCTVVPLYTCPGNPPPAWVANGPYVSGSQVLGRDGYSYTCVSGPYSEFCRQAAFEPSVGTNWTLAWTQGEQCVVFEYPDLAVDSVSAPRTTCRPGVAATSLLSANISNISPFDTQHDEVYVTFYDGHPSARRVIGTVAVLGVEPGGTSTLASVTWNPARLGALDLYVVVDDKGNGVGQETEASELNNVMRLPTQVVCP